MTGKGAPVTVDSRLPTIDYRPSTVDPSRITQIAAIVIARPPWGPWQSPAFERFEIAAVAYGSFAMT